MSRFIYITLGILIVGGLAVGAWWYLSSPAPTPATNNGTGFGTGAPSVSVTPNNQGTTSTTGADNSTATQQKVFRVGSGPIVGATVVEYTRPTTTVARYVQQNNGHIFDLVLDSSGAVPKAVSNTTIPGVQRALWTRGGEGVVMQYLDENTTKTVSLVFPSQQATTSAVSIKFLPDGITDIAVSPSGTSIVYLLRSQTGIKGYIANSDGSSSRELFSLPLREVAVVWPAERTILTYSRPTTGTPGVAFSINTTSGAVVPLLYAAGLSVHADRSYSHLIYQTDVQGRPSTYARSLSSGTNASLSFDPAPERCVWGAMATSTLYCALPLQFVPATYLTMWHIGTADAPEAVVSYTFPSGNSNIVAVPGGADGGVESTIDTLSVAANGKYVLFVRRGDRSLWGVRL